MPFRQRGTTALTSYQIDAMRVYLSVGVLITTDPDRSHRLPDVERRSLQRRQESLLPRERSGGSGDQQQDSGQ